MSAPPVSDLQRANQRYRAMLIAREAAAVQDIGRAYKQTWDALEGRILDIAERADPSDFAIFQSERYRTLQAETALRMEVIEERVHETVIAEQRFGATQGREQALRQIQAAYGDIGREMAELNRIPMEQLGDLIGNLSDGSPLRDLLHQLGPDARRRIEQGLMQGITLGLNPREVARMTRDAFGGNMARALTVSRTEMLRAARSSQLRHFAENSHAVARWRWTAALDSRTCMSCVMMHGREFPLTEDFASHPNCRCAPSPVPPRSRLDVEPGDAWFERQPADIQRQMMGGKKYDAYKKGLFDLPELVAEHDDRQWGKSRSEASLVSILGQRGMRDFLMAAD
jgi:SPP1 gp7 family putative phage head morphogenesis protein